MAEEKPCFAVVTVGPGTVAVVIVLGLARAARMAT